MNFGILDTQDEIAYALEPKKRDFVLPLRRIVTPDEIATICSFLASEDSSLLTGAVLVAEGALSSSMQNARP
jgi:NAD(P)-dependent dehydrogenase (short-subunit alcohol dehydrogenase family)